MSDSKKEGTLNTEHAGRKIWLVKVPPFVAQRWNAICDKSMNEEFEAVGPKLGKIRFTPNATDSSGAGPANKFELSLDNPETAGLPREYIMNVTTQNMTSMLAFSDNAGSMAVEGTVYQKFDTEVAREGGPGGVAGGGGGVASSLGVEYRKLSRERHQAAATKSRTIQVITDSHTSAMRQPVAIGTKRKAAPTEKRIALEREQLLAMLFTLFERQSHWTFTQLQQQTQQPTDHLKKVLQEIAVQAKRGPYKDLWGLIRKFAVDAAPE